MLTNYQDVLDIGLSPDAETLQARLVAAAAKLGFGLSAGALIRGRLASRRAAVHSFGNPPDGFVEASKSLDVGLQDPLLSAMMNRSGLFTYDERFYVEAGAGALWDNQAPFGYRSGMAFAVHEPSHAEVFFFGVDGPDGLPAAPAQQYELQGGLMLIALHAHEAAKRLWTPAPEVDLNAVTAPELSELRWAADATAVHYTRGLTVITKPGQTEVQRQTMRKLGAANRAQAVLRAIEGGLIDR